MSLRPYQLDAVNAVIQHLRKATDPIMVEAATGAGKSHMIAEIARSIFAMTGKRVLCTAPSAELVTQNHAKFVATGNKASVFSASAGSKSLRHPVVFGSPLTVKNRISAFKHDYAMVLIDECDLITPTVQAIIEAMREGNPNLRVVGFTATPYRLGSGYIYREGPDGRRHGEDAAKDPYFTKCVYRITAPELIEMGFLTPIKVGSINADTYDTHSLTPNKLGKFNSADVDRAYHGHGRKTALIVGDIVRQARGRNAVLIYAATIQHAQEVMASLPPELSEIVTGTTKGRDKILQRVKDGKTKYVVNVGVLTVGVDLPIVDTIAVLRKTESARLLQQILGRGIRLYDGKAECLYLDYTSNMEDHFPDGDVFNPEVRATHGGGAGRPCKAECPDCGYENEFSYHKERLDYAHDKAGYALDVFGSLIQPPLPVHHGRRCFGFVDSRTRCGYRWAGKDCPACTETNDIAARYCYACKAEIVDPNEKLLADFKAHKKDPYAIQTDEVISVTFKPTVSRAGNEVTRADWVTPYRQFSTWHIPNSKHPNQKKDWDKFTEATNGAVDKPETVTYHKDRESGFFRIIGYGREPDKLAEAA